MRKKLGIVMTAAGAGVFVALLVTVISLSVFLYSLRQQSNRALDLVASDYP